MANIDSKNVFKIEVYPVSGYVNFEKNLHLIMRVFNDGRYNN